MTRGLQKVTLDFLLLSARNRVPRVVALFMNSSARPGPDSDGFSGPRDTHQAARWDGRLVRATGHAEFDHVLGCQQLVPRRWCEEYKRADLGEGQGTSWIGPPSWGGAPGAGAAERAFLEFCGHVFRILWSCF